MTDTLVRAVLGVLARGWACERRTGCFMMAKLDLLIRRILNLFKAILPAPKMPWIFTTAGTHAQRPWISHDLNLFPHARHSYATHACATHAIAQLSCMRA
jgi:hypothetical protein